MSNTYFQFKQFTVHQDRSAMKVTTDASLFGGWAAEKIGSRKSKIENKKALDIGSGTGLLSLMIAQQNPQLIIDAIEIDKDAAEQAKENINQSPWKNAISVINADIKNHHGKKYDIVISNPPFYENELKPGDSKKDIAHHSKELTLESLFTITKNLLADNGSFFFLLPYKRKDELEKLLTQSQLFIHEMVLVKQSTRHGYFRIMILGGITKPEEIKTAEISIWDNEQKYTGKFVELLKEYYLYL